METRLHARLTELLVRHSTGWAFAIVAANVGVATWLAAPEATVADTPAPPISASLTLLRESRSPLETIERPQPRVCRAWGPFSDQAALNEVHALLTDSNGSLAQALEVREMTLEADPDYMVYVGPERSREGIRRVRRELASQDIDSFRIAQGRLTNHVSVGVFTQRSRAQLHLERMQSLGYEAGIEELPRSHKVLHLTASVAPDTALAVAPIGACEDIAHDTQFL